MRELEEHVQSIKESMQKGKSTCKALDKVICRLQREKEELMSNLQCSTILQCVCKEEKLYSLEAKSEVLLNKPISLVGTCRKKENDDNTKTANICNMIFTYLHVNEVEA